MALRRVLRGIAWLALAATLVPAVAYFRGEMELGAVKRWMLLATVVWFAAAWWGSPPKAK